MSDADDHTPDDEVIITVPAEMQAGVWANWARVNEGDHAFGEPPTSPTARVVPSGQPAPRAGGV